MAILESRYFKILAALLLISWVLYPQLETAKLQPTGDELYHVSQPVVDGEVQSLNPFDKDYEFLGHPPGYPLSLFLWMRIFPHNHISAHFHALTFSFLALFLFFLFCTQSLPWISSLCATYAFSQTFVIQDYGDRNLADTPGLVLALLALFFLSRKKIGLTSIAFCLLILFRESGLAFPVAVGLVFLFSTQPSISKKQLALVCTPSLLLLGFFFLANILWLGFFSRHPYAQGNLGHTQVTFFSWGPEKINAIKNLWSWMKQDFHLIHLLLPLGMAALVFKRPKDHQWKVNFSLLVAASTYFLFYTFYADVIPRDITPVIATEIFLAFYAIERIFPAKLGAVFSLVLVSPWVWASPPYPRETLRRDVEFYSKMTSYLEQNHPDETVCYRWPLRGLRPVHGYFKDARRFHHNCRIDSDLICTSPLQPASIREYLENRVNEEKYILDYSFKMENAPTEYRFECYKKPPAFKHFKDHSQDPTN